MAATEKPNAREMERLAAEVGLGRLAELSPAAVEKALSAARRLKSSMPRDLALADEPAHVYRASEEA